MFQSDAGRARYLAAYDAVLRDWPVPLEELDVPTCLGPTHVLAGGAIDSPALILLPSLAASAAVWRPNVGDLSQQFRTYAVDVIGQPGKSNATRQIRNRLQFVDWFTDLLDGLGVERASIVGCSFGCFLALNQALLTPERIERVVIISPVGIFSSQYWKLFYAMRIRSPRRQLTRRIAGIKRGSGIAGARDQSVRLIPKDASWAALMAVMMAEAPKVNVISASVFSNAQLRSIRTPTLLLIGEHERL
jgi:pimeloyl-ACP methyl ester carboxylesterase